MKCAALEELKSVCPMLADAPAPVAVNLVSPPASVTEVSVPDHRLQGPVLKNMRGIPSIPFREATERMVEEQGLKEFPFEVRATAPLLERLLHHGGSFLGHHGLWRIESKVAPL